ncbi:hypothetical protein [Actinomyces sp. oral taxon 448]|uniref:hypothetical protein n=1 Tax=Actinomyces sp. oral taxon 448 TaxID=712124 RepID=UPI0025BFF36E|nr:hypothetical protein [Actinomyces sp. oral taxon 448]
MDTLEVRSRATDVVMSEPQANMKIYIVNSKSMLTIIPLRGVLSTTVISAALARDMRSAVELLVRNHQVAGIGAKRMKEETTRRVRERHMSRSEASMMARNLDMMRPLLADDGDV